MDKYNIIIWLLPIVFMIHDFEEIIFFKSWISKNKEYLKEKFPKITKRILGSFDNLSTSAFVVAVAEEFVLLSLITVGSVLFDNYLLWLAAFMGFFVHLFAHLAQWIVLKRYLPAICTTFFALIYCTYSLYEIIAHNLFQISEIVVWTITGIVLVGVNLVFAHKLAEKFVKRQKYDSC
ncbi:MAG: HXXEE domain-containing protein [Marinilabiliaceae bacterium]|nr:HXXEE domain-containing protein [Marinilabiliaceae bacterium]